MMFESLNLTSWLKKLTYPDNPSFVSYFLNIPRSLVEESVAEPQSDRYCKTMATFKQWVFFYGVVMRCKSLNNLCKNLLLFEDKLTYLASRNFSQ
ncbi:MAG: DUF4372 domain-containing protein [Bacteroidota bacterium]